MSDKFRINKWLMLIGVMVVANVAVSLSMAMPMTFTERSGEGHPLTFIMDTIVSFLSNKAEDIEESSCNLCKVVVGALKALVATDMSNDESIDFVTGLCTSLNIENADVCYDIMVHYLPEIIFTYKRIEVNISVDNVCAFIIGGSCVVLEEFLPIFDWNVTFPTPGPSYVASPQPSPTSPTIRILHISDTHIDEQYLEGSVSNCNEPLCCRANQITVPNTKPSYAGKYGGLNGSCDIPRITLESMLDYATKNLQYDWVYWTGDIPPHDVWNQTKEGNIRMLHSTCSLVRNFFPAHYTVFPSCGNHESEPCNSFPVPPVYGNYNISYLYSQLDSVWPTFIPDINHSTVLKGGYYAYDVRPGLRVISLNMNYCHGGNWWLLVDSQDPTDELKWLIHQLDDAEKNHIMVHIIGHIPPGLCTWVWSRNYRDIINRYKGTIAGHFYGHTHNDEFEIIYDDVHTSNPVSVAHIGPSITTNVGLNPAFRIYTVDGDHQGSTWQVLDYEEYWLDINKANEDGFPTWELLYTAKSSYHMVDFTPTSFNNLVNRMEANNSLFQQFYRHYHRVFTNPPCEDDCKTDLLCRLRKGWAGYLRGQCGSSLSDTFL